MLTETTRLPIVLREHAGGSQCPVCFREWPAEFMEPGADVLPGRPCPARECDSHHTERCNAAAKHEADSDCLCPDALPGMIRDGTVVVRS
jgi:hypothetical protein